MATFAITYLLTIVIDAVFGDPDWLYKRIWHPAFIFGKLIFRMEELLYPDEQNERREFWAGVKLVVRLVSVVGIGALVIHLLLQQFVWGWVIEAALASTLIAQRSLYNHVKAVAIALAADGIAAGRTAVSMIVGRETKELDEAAVSRAAIESCAENFSDGVAAPLFWFAILGLPGLAIYKAINTADSMIGHRNERYQHFGTAAARLDDWINWPAARLAGFAIVLATLFTRGRATAKASFNMMMRDARKHKSPNAGWQEAAFAGALNIALAGPRVYDGVKVDDYWMGEGGNTELSSCDINSALKLYITSCVVISVVFTVAVVATQYLPGLDWFVSFILMPSQSPA